MGLSRLFRPAGVKRPEVDAALDAELERHAQAMRDIVDYRMKQETEHGEQPNS